MIKPIENTDIEQVVNIHLTCFPKSNSTSYGKKFLQAYYKGYVGVDNAVAFVYEVDGKIAGFIVGGVNMQTLSRQIVSNSLFAFFISVVFNLIKNPIERASKFAEYISHYLLPKTPKKLTFYSDETAGLSSIAVSSEFQRQGIANKLMTAFLEELKVRAIRACRLGVEAGNLPARKFYERHGFEQMDPKGAVYIIFFDDNYKNQFKLESRSVRVDYQDTV